MQAQLSEYEYIEPSGDQASHVIITQLHPESNQQKAFNKGLTLSGPDTAWPLLSLRPALAPPTPPVTSPSALASAPLGSRPVAAEPSPAAALAPAAGSPPWGEAGTDAGEAAAARLLTRGAEAPEACAARLRAT
jgi:hypothetical protein